MDRKPYKPCKAPQSERKYSASITRPGQGFTPGEWVRRLQSGTAQMPPPGKRGVIVTPQQAHLQRMNLDYTERAKLLQSELERQALDAYRSRAQAQPVEPPAPDTTAVGDKV